MPELSEPQHLWGDEKRDLTLEVSPSPSAAFVALLERTRFGTAGLRYRRLDVAGQLAALPRPLFVSLRRADEIVGTYALARMPIHTAAQTYEGIYRGALSVDEGSQGQGLGRFMVTRTLAWLGDVARDTGRTLISYGCIERTNERSLALLKSLGARQLGTLRTQLVYRQWPRAKVKLLRLDAQADPWVGDMQQAADADCALRLGAQAKGSFFACSDGKGVAAAAFARLIRLDFDRIGQPWDALYDYLLAHIGPARRRFDPHNFTYLKLDSPVVGNDDASMWPDFISTLMAEFGTHMAMITLDPARPAYRLLEQAGVFSGFSRATQQHLAVMASSHGENPVPLARFAGERLALHPIDL
ncbi:MAG: GNAT family N-acetyltransferase [Pseudomonadota bacterium]